MVIYFLVLGLLIWITPILISAAIARFNSRFQSQLPQPIGDLSCQYNARSPLLRCAVKPQGPCRCEHYQPRSSSQALPPSRS